jgi:outer membrane receptor protein involved in Fe transport
MYGDDDNTIRIDGWQGGVTNARASWRGTTTSATLEPFVAALNIIDRKYIGSVTANGSFGRVFEPASRRAVYAGISITARGR